MPRSRKDREIVHFLTCYRAEYCFAGHSVYVPPLTKFLLESTYTIFLLTSFARSGIQSHWQQSPPSYPHSKLFKREEQKPLASNPLSVPVHSDKPSHSTGRFLGDALSSKPNGKNPGTTRAQPGCSTRIGIRQPLNGWYCDTNCNLGYMSVYIRFTLLSGPRVQRSSKNKPTVTAKSTENASIGTQVGCFAFLCGYRATFVSVCMCILWTTDNEVCCVFHSKRNFEVHMYFTSYRLLKTTNYDVFDQIGLRRDPTQGRRFGGSMKRSISCVWC